MPAVEIIAHRGWSGRHPEMTRAAYLDAIDLAERTGRTLALECDAQFSADGELVLLHDRSLNRIAGRDVAPGELTMAELRQIDVGSWATAEPGPDQRTLLTLPELFGMVRDARARGVPVELAVETKHPNPRGLEVDRACLQLVADHGWLGAGSPVRMISFNPESVELFVTEAPHLRRSLLIEKTLGPWADGHLPDGVDTVGVDRRLVAAQPDYLDALFARGNRLHLWTVNETDDIADWVARGATGITTDHPDRAFAALG